MQEAPKFNLNASLIESLPEGFNGKVQEMNLQLDTVEKLQQFIGKFVPIPIKLDLSKPILLDVKVSAYGFNIQTYMKVGRKK